MIGAIILQIVLIALNAIFASAEIAVVSMNSTKLKIMAETNKKAKRLVNLTEDSAKFLATIQVAITLSGFLGSAYAADNFAEPLVNWLVGMGVGLSRGVLNSICVFLITLIIAYFSIVFGELIPKRIAMKYTDKVAIGLANLLTVVSVVFAPIVWALTASTNGVLRLLHIDPEEEEKVTEEEIRMMVSAGSEDGTIGENENVLIQNVFEFNDTLIADICTHRIDVVGLYLEDDPSEWAEVIHNNRHSYYPIFGESSDDVVGILDAKDYFRLDDFSKDNIFEKAVEKPYFVPENMKADVLFRKMKSTSNYFAVAIEEYGGMSGIVTIHDLLEILVGDLDDPDEEPTPEDIVKIDENTWEIQGMAGLKEVEEAIGVDLPDEDVDTFGGFICGVLGEVPDDGSRFELDTHGLHIEVNLVEDHRIEQTVVTKLAPEEKEEDEEASKDKEKSKEKDKQ